MTTINLKNIIIKEKEDKNFNKYYLIIDQETDQAYFCFEKAVREGWNELVSNWESIKEVELEFETNERGNNKVISIFVNKEDEVLL
ncbi:MAG: hypothetical protein MRERC_2c092 [Mycoplasmataceae bacterium RC_NB112A]|nr:MAG: hypothetical protein MRERC_2c092 [Mycoplasmataceae bacterium RC_NB112A]